MPPVIRKLENEAVKESLLKLLPAFALTVSGAVLAEDNYPNRPITMVVPFAAGSGTDAIARVMADALGDRLGQPVIVSNKAGANGQIGVEYAAKLAPDGYSLLMATSTTHSINPGMYKALRYDPVNDFTPVARTGI